MYAADNFSIDREQARLQLELLGYKPGDKIFMRGFYASDDPRKAEDKGIKADKLVFSQAEEWQQEGRGIYFVVNGCGHKNEDVKSGRAIFYEHDNLTIEQQVSLWEGLGLPEPTFQVHTGGKSIHSYWVFSEPIDISDWKKLQIDLLEFADADRSIKNPARVMRLAGAWHPSTGQQSRIISASGHRYSFEELRGKVPAPVQVQSSIFTPAPLTNFLTKDDRALVNGGVGQGSRNPSGAKLARNLIGTAERLRFLGINFEETPRQLFNDFCQRCNPPLDPREADQIWKSAEKDRPSPSLTDDALQNCHTAWMNRENRSNNFTPTTKVRTGTLVNHPKFSPAPLEGFETEIDALISEDLKRSQLQVKLAELGRKYCLPLADVTKIYRQREEEIELAALSRDAAAEIDRLLSAQKSALDLFDLLPVHLAKPITTLAQRFNLKPEAYLLSLLTQTNSLFKNGTKLVDPFPATDWTEIPPTIFAALVAPPGAGKTPIAKSMILKPMSALKDAAQRTYDAAREEYEIDMQHWQSEKKGDRGPKPEAPAKRYYHFHSQSTLEGILCQLTKQPADGAMLFADELEGYFSGQNQYKSGGKKRGGNDKSILLSLWSGIAPEGVMRKAEGGTEAYSLPKGANLGIYGGIQPEILAEILGDGTDPQGEFGRFLYVTQPLTVTKLSDFIGMPRIEMPLAEIYERLESLPPQTFSIDSEAQKTLIAFHDNWCGSRVLTESRPALVNYLKKLPEHAARIAMGLQILWNAGTIIGSEVMKAAIAVAAYSFHQLEAILIEQKAAGSELSPALAKIISFVERRKSVTLTEISKIWCHSRRPDKETVVSWCRELCALGYLQKIGDKFSMGTQPVSVSPFIPFQLQPSNYQNLEYPLQRGEVSPPIPTEGDKRGYKGDTKGDSPNPYGVSDRGPKGDKGDTFVEQKNFAPTAELAYEDENIPEALAALEMAVLDEDRFLVDRLYENFKPEVLGEASRQLGKKSPENYKILAEWVSEKKLADKLSDIALNEPPSALRKFLSEHPLEKILAANERLHRTEPDVARMIAVIAGKLAGVPEEKLSIEPEGQLTLDINVPCQDDGWSERGH